MNNNKETGNTVTPRENETCKIEGVFADYFSNWDIRLPTESIQERQPGEIQSHGWNIQYKFGTDDEGRGYLDFYASHRMTNDRHERIYTTGEIKGLPATKEMIIYPPNATESQKDQARREQLEHNREVWKELRRKGFRWIAMTPYEIKQHNVHPDSWNTPFLSSDRKRIGLAQWCNSRSKRCFADSF